MKKMLIACNWKMNLTTSESVALVQSIIEGIKNKKISPDILVCPPFTSIDAVSKVLKGTKIFYGAQNCHFESKGAVTGEISIPMLKELGCRYIIIGHSERRTYFFENDELVNKKARAVLASGLIPIICIGESLREREENRTFDVLKRQIEIGLSRIEPEYCVQIVIAYEPVWAIGTGVSAEPEQIQEAHSYIKKELIRVLGKRASSIIVLYGGSVTDENAQSILELKDVHGGLIGGASLKSDIFLSIIETANLVLA
ncbi:MAG: triose-phosphate isomerase [Ignavibacteria bacterium GWB2_35_12]|nr:MAG: triose-phosphate isomerase [Ignavibacteria bacterium GWA2_35_8]OGU41616.1 MAG: triose-phosphate isomerase [Ignavibacteria bacterium GWB2_35_12]OGU91356.1 MAG: triose-phosphate isomerase [Ignavibacteria bacterium RIFOXYA2_FULL_35_10]OGV24950.1 MAG: triose-phosphate isomerase [Ignavibacteria bacterium RIFOXYC2_FULL_35_21]